MQKYLRRIYVYKNVDIYQIRGKIFVQGYATTNGIIDLPYGPIVRVNENDVLGLGKAIIGALDSCNDQVIPYTSNWGSMSKPMIKETECKSWKDFVQSTKYVLIELEMQTLIFTPVKVTGYGRHHRDYERLNDKIIEMQHALVQGFFRRFLAVINRGPAYNLDPEKVGQNALKALENYESIFSKNT